MKIHRTLAVGIRRSLCGIGLHIHKHVNVKENARLRVLYTTSQTRYVVYDGSLFISLIS